MKYYTGVGARKTPDNILSEMRSIAKVMSQDLYVVRSGGAEGADTAFEVGAGANTEIYLPWDNFNHHTSQDGVHLDSQVLFNYKKRSTSHHYTIRLGINYKIHTKNYTLEMFMRSWVLI